MVIVRSQESPVGVLPALTVNKAFAVFFAWILMKMSTLPNTCRGGDPRHMMAFDYALVFEQAPIGLCVSTENTILVCNAKACHLFGYTPEELWSQPISILYGNGSSDIGAEKSDLARQPDDLAPPISQQRILRNKHGTTFWCDVTSMIGSNLAANTRIWTFREILQAKSPDKELSAREKQLAASIMNGKTSRHIAGEMNLSIRTVEYYRQRLMRKLNVANRTELILRLAHLSAG